MFQRQGQGGRPGGTFGSDQVYDDHIEYVDFPYLDTGFAGDGGTAYFMKLDYVNAANDLEDYSHDLWRSLPVEADTPFSTWTGISLHDHGQ